MKEQNNIKAGVLGLCLAACAGVASAQAPQPVPTQTVTRGLYLGAALGQSEAKEYDCTALPQCENRGTIGKFFMGLQFGRNWALELALTDLGKISSSSQATGFTDSVKVRLGEADLVASYPVSGRLMIYGKGGVYYAQSTNDRNGARIKESNAGPTWGFGVQYYVWNGLAVRGEGQRYMKVGGGNLGDSDYNSYTIGVLYKLR